MGKAYAIVPAAGKSTRMGGQVNKQLLDLAGRPVVGHALRALLSVPVAGIVLVVARGEEPVFLARLEGILTRNNIKIVTGGDTRHNSVRQGLLALPAGVDLVVVHDGARPLVKPQNIREVICAAEEWGAATLAVPVKDTLKVAGADNLVLETPPRDNLWQAQTPQVFHRALLEEAHRAAREEGYTGTDDASLVERLGRSVKLVPGDYANIKITSPEDLLVATALLK